MKTNIKTIITMLLTMTILTSASCYEDFGDEGDYRNITSQRTIHAWPEGKIHYSIEGRFNELEREYLQNAMNEWSDYAKVAFIQYNETVNNAGNEETDKLARVLHVGRTEGESYATAGYADEPVLMISSTDRMYQRYIVQLFGHVLGLLNEHQRPDRDNYIQVNWENIDSEALQHYAKIDNSLIEEEDFAYDTMSVMHYTRTQGAREFGLRAFDYLYQEYDTKAHYVSKGDAEKISFIYGAPVE